MFAGKSEELLRRVRRARLAGLSVELVNHALDERSGSSQVASHAGQTSPSHSFSDVRAIEEMAGRKRVDLLAIDEAQFFGPDLVDVVTEIVLSNTTVVVAGLCVTFDGGPFEPIPTLMAVAEEVVKLTAVCAVCGDDAAFHQRVRPGAINNARSAAAELVGGAESYQARCRRHFKADR